MMYESATSEKSLIQNQVKHTNAEVILHAHTNSSNKQNNLINLVTVHRENIEKALDPPEFRAREGSLKTN